MNAQDQDQPQANSSAQQQNQHDHQHQHHHHQHLHEHQDTAKPRLSWANPADTATATKASNSKRDDDEEKWHFNRKERKASAAASEVGENARHTSSVDREMFAELMEKTRGMSSEELHQFLLDNPLPRGAEIMRGKDGYLQSTGGYSGTM